ncbi:MAG TPA: hypothetical protein VN651_04665 [Gemmatimonadaceae bacterium]|nr:hypothetical protein [Gemmatimonadaceae bacterium]
MRIRRLVTVAALVVARDLAANALGAQSGPSVDVMAQAIPLVTRADPTATRGALTEGYLSQPVVMAHAAWGPLRGVGTLNLEGLTLERGELNTGGYGEGFVDRRHPHAYLHELLAGVETSRDSVHLSLFAGRGFAPFGSDDPMMRPFEKYPVNHHLAQILERVVAVGAARYGPVIGEFGLFNGDEPVGPGAAPNFSRFGDSWASRVTLLPIRGAELSASLASVKSPEVRAGHGLDQRKASVVARYDRMSGNRWLYGLLEWERTGERDRGSLVTRLGSLLGEAAACRGGVIAAARLERTDRPEEEQTLDPFRAPRPEVDLSNLGVSRWTTLTLSLSAPRVGVRMISGRPFVEVARIGVAAGTPAGIFDPESRYGANRMWMLSAGVRLRAGMAHDRMGRYGAALPPSSEGMAGMAGMASMGAAESTSNMPDMSGMKSGRASERPNEMEMNTRCAL